MSTTTRKLSIWLRCHLTLLWGLCVVLLPGEGFAARLQSAAGAASVATAAAADPIPSAPASAAPASPEPSLGVDGGAVPLAPSELPLAEPTASARPDDAADPEPSYAPRTFGPVVAGAQAAPAPSAPAPEPADVKVRDRTVVTLRAVHEGLSPQARARAANQRVAALLGHVEELGTVHAEMRRAHDGSDAPDAVLFVGDTALLVLGQADADAAGEPSLEAFAEVTSNAVGDAFAAEKTRSAVATTVFRLSLCVFLGLIVFVVLTRGGQYASSLRARFSDEESVVNPVHIQRVPVLSAGAVRALLTAGVTFGYRALQALLVLGYLLFSLSLFDGTRPWTERLTGLVVTPVSGVATRLAVGMPLLLLLAVGAFAVSLLMRFTGQFFDSVARGETYVEWLPRELARPASLVARGGLFIAALAVLAPLLTGHDDGLASHAATVAFAALGLATLPSLASAAFGAPLVFSRRLRRNDYVELGHYAGRVREVGLLELRLEDERGGEVRVPHLYAFVHPLRIVVGQPTVEVELVVGAQHDLAEVEQLLLGAARKLSARADVRLLALDADGARYRVVSAAKAGDRGTLTAVLAAALKEGGITLGRGGTR